MDIRIISKPITKADAKEIAKEFYVDMVKGVVDVEKGVIALGGQYHTDAKHVLVDAGSDQKNIWGFNFFPDDNRIEYVSLINIRPLQNNSTVEIQDKNLRGKMEKIIRHFIL